jgi:cytochrome c-type biogenesis protein CcmH/NrfF
VIAPPELQPGSRAIGASRPRRAIARLGPVLTAITLAASASGLVAASGLAAAAAAVPRASLPTIERQVMCVTCKIPLNVAQSPQSSRERAYIQSLIDQGQTEAQIKQSLVGQYGPTVLGLPSTHGFDLAAYLVPLAVVLALLATLAVLLPRWRRQARAQADRQQASDGSGLPLLSSTDAERLDADLARFD